MQFLCQHDHLRKIECHIYHHGIQYSILSNKGTHFIAKEVQQWMMLM